MAELISNKNIEYTKKQIKKAERPIAVLARDDKYNRSILEYGKFDIMLSPEIGERRKDIQKQLDSGLNSIMAKIAKKNNISIGIDIKSIKNEEKEDKAIRLARIKQNVDICKKTKTDLEIINESSKKGAFSFLISLGASTKQAKDATTKTISF